MKAMARTTTNSGQRSDEFCAMDTAVGCADIIPPPNVWWKRSDDGANSTFGCTAKLLRVHQMSCVGNQWHSDTTPDNIDCPDSPRIGMSLTELMLSVRRQLRCFHVHCT